MPFRRSQVALSKVDDTQIELGGSRGGIDFDRPFEGFEGGSGLSGQGMRDAQLIGGVGKSWINLQREFEFGDGLRVPLLLKLPGTPLEGLKRGFRRSVREGLETHDAAGQRSWNGIWNRSRSAIAPDHHAPIRNQDALLPPPRDVFLHSPLVLLGAWLLVLGLPI